MKLWQKITACGAGLFFLCSTISGKVILEQNYNRQINRETERILSHSYDLYVSLVTMMPMTLEKGLDGAQALPAILEIFMQGDAKQQVAVELTDEEGTVLYQNKKGGSPKDRKEWIGLEEGEQRYLLTEDDGSLLIFTAIKLQVQGTDYIISCVGDLTEIKESKAEQQQFIWVLNGVVCMIYGLLIFIISRILTRPIRQLSFAAKKIAKGDYHERVMVKNADELGELAQGFNEMAATVEKTMAELLQSNEDKQQFIDNFTHELRTPLTSIVGYASLLKGMRYDEETFAESLDIIYIEGKRLAAMAEKLMALTYKNAGDLETSKENMRQILQAVLSAVQMHAGKKGVRIHVQCPDIYLDCDADFMKELCMNLLDNAVKASTFGGEVAVTASEDQSICTICFRDFGCGIPKEHIKWVTEPFYMVDKSRTRSQNGAGLGLALCKRIVELHCGQMEIESEENKGTVITVRLPKQGGVRG